MFRAFTYLDIWRPTREAGKTTVHSQNIYLYIWLILLEIYHSVNYYQRNMLNFPLYWLYFSWQFLLHFLLIVYILYFHVKLNIPGELTHAEVKHCGLRSINTLIILGVDKNCLIGGRGLLLLYQFTRAIRQTSNYRVISLLSTSYKILFNILLSRLSPYVDEIAGDHQCVST